MTIDDTARTGGRDCSVLAKQIHSRKRDAGSHDHAAFRQQFSRNDSRLFEFGPVQRARTPRDTARNDRHRPELLVLFGHR